MDPSPWAKLRKKSNVFLPDDSELSRQIPDDLVRESDGLEHPPHQPGWPRGFGGTNGVYGGRAVGVCQPAASLSPARPVPGWKPVSRSEPRKSDKIIINKTGAWRRRHQIFHFTDILGSAVWPYRVFPAVWNSLEPGPSKYRLYLVPAPCLLSSFYKSIFYGFILFVHLWIEDFRMCQVNYFCQISCVHCRTCLKAK